MLSKQTIREFQKIWQRDYGQELSDQEASRLAHDVVRYFDVLAQVKSRQEDNDD
jgi:hypothetical protein